MNQANAHSVIIWVHSDCLNSKGAALAAYPNAPALWVWDDALLHDWQIGFKQVRFIYDCLLELPVSIQRGDVITELTQFAHQHQATRVATTSSPSPGFLHICQQLQANGLQVEIYEDIPVAKTEQVNPFDLNHFAHCWQAARLPAF
jgi:hypothetical protein